MNHYLVITGASRGVGKSTVQYFLNQGWSAVNISRHNCELPNVTNINIDLTKKNWQVTLHDKFLRLIEGTQKICLVHNAAIFEKDNMYNLSDEKLRKILELHVVAPMILNQLFLPKMASGSSIIYMGSPLAEKAVANTASYSISKHAVAGTMKVTCQDIVRPDIHTCCICPGHTDTDVLKETLGNHPEIIAAIKNMVAAKRLIQPAEISSLIYYCANNPVINGSIIHANLGQIER